MPAAKILMLAFSMLSFSAFFFLAASLLASAAFFFSVTLLGSKLDVNTESRGGVLEGEGVDTPSLPPPLLPVSRFLVFFILVFFFSVSLPSPEPSPALSE